MTIPLLALEDVHAAYLRKEILRGVSLTVNRGEIVGLLGGNGSGKSTTLKAIAGLLRPTKGRIFFDGVDISSDGLYARHEMGIGYLMQGGRVFPNLTVAENFLIATSHAIQRRHSKNAVLGSIFPALTGHASDRAGLLSGGQRQMLAIELAIEMTIAQGPVMLLLDEPAGGLTTNLSRHIIRQITQKIREFHWGALMVEQNITIVQEFCDRALRLKDGTVEVAPV